jgi:D-3-phosphoglycerate dehydrogenase
MRYKILNMADISICPQVFDVLKDIADIVTLNPDLKTLQGSIRDYDVYFASLKLVIGKSILDRAEKLKAIATPSTGTDHIDVEYAKSKGIKIISLKDDTEFLNGVTATAELAWGLLLAAIRRVPWSFDAAKSGVWGRDAFRGHQLSGKTLGIIGYGRLGRMVAQYGKAFRMNVVACDVREVNPEAHVRMVSIDELLKVSDVISIHIHLTPENRGIINRAAFAKMKKGAVLINTSRGAVVDEKAFLDALESGQLLAAGIDVIDGEWNENLKEHSLIRYARSNDNLLITPHVGGITFESQAMGLEQAVKKLKLALEKHL